MVQDRVLKRGLFYKLSEYNYKCNKKQQQLNSRGQKMNSSLNFRNERLNAWKMENFELKMFDALVRNSNN